MPLLRYNIFVIYKLYKTAEVGVLRKTLQDVEQKNASDREALEQLAKKQKEVNLAIGKIFER